MPKTPPAGSSSAAILGGARCKLQSRHTPIEEALSEDLRKITVSATQPTPRNNRHSREIFAEAEKVLVGGVNSPVRAFRSIGCEPLIIERSQGEFLYDADGNQ